jgi:class 3 adenylate cyclase
MKYTYTCLLALFFVFPLLSQSDSLKQMEATLAQTKGEAFVRQAIYLAEAYLAEGLFEKSLQKAEAAINEAKKSNLPSSIAEGLHHKGKALSKMPGKRNSNKAFDAFEESNKLTKDPTLRKDNLLKMKDLAVQLGKKKELDAIERELAVIRGEAPPSALANENKGGLFNKRKRAMQQQLMQAQHETESLAGTVTELSEEQKALKAQQETLRLQQNNLQALVQKKEAAIQNMTEQQMRQQLIFAEQERILDSLTFSSIIDSMQLSQTEAMVSQQEAELKEKEAEIQLRKSQRNLLIAVAGFGLLLALGLFHRFHTMRAHNAVLAEKNRVIEAERKRSEELLLNILPVAVADELKLNGSAQAQHYEEATVLFTDFKGFSAISKLMSPADLVQALDYAFKNFDRIIGKYGLEKIKTIGDAYMCAGGLPGKDATSPVQVVRAALEIQQFLREWNSERVGRGEPAFEARIGIHTGPLVAGVVGSKKFAYDIWGDTVNVASRMETSSEAGRVNISAATFKYVKDTFSCEYRGKVPAKNVGEVEMYYVEDRA